MSKLTPLPIGAIAARGATHVFEYDHSDLTEATANTAQTLDIGTYGAGYLVEVVNHDLDTAFKDASDAAFNNCAVTIGDSGDVDRLLASTQVNENGTEVLAAAGTGTVFAPTSDTTVQVTVNAMADKALADIDTGKARVYLRITPPSKF